MSNRDFKEAEMEKTKLPPKRNIMIRVTQKEWEAINNLARHQAVKNQSPRSLGSLCREATLEYLKRNPLPEEQG